MGIKLQLMECSVQERNQLPYWVCQQGCLCLEMHLHSQSEFLMGFQGITMDCPLEIQQGHLCPVSGIAEQIRVEVKGQCHSPIGSGEISTRSLRLVMHLPKVKELYVREWETNLRKRTCSVSFPPFVHGSTSQVSVREARERERERGKKDGLHLPLSAVQGKAVRPRAGMWRILMFKTGLKFCSLQRLIILITRIGMFYLLK